MKWTEGREERAKAWVVVGSLFVVAGGVLRLAGYAFGLSSTTNVVTFSHLAPTHGIALALIGWCWGWLLRRHPASPEPAPPPPEPELVAGPIVGNRGWSLAWTDEGWRLRSHVARHVWQPGVVEATCLPATTPISSGEWRHGPDEPCPALECKCGIYGLWEGELLSPIVGTIAAEGRVIPGTKGFRAQKARVQTIDVITCTACASARPAKRVVLDNRVAISLCSVCEEDGRSWAVRVVAGNSTNPVVREFPASQVLDSLRTTYGV